MIVEDIHEGDVKMDVAEDNTISNKLYDMLCEVHDDDFVIAIMSFARHDDDRQIIIDYINQARNATPEEISLLALKLHQNRYPEKYIWEK